MLGVDTVAVRDRGMLSATDIQVWRRAQEEARALVTINESDFERIAREADEHHGLITIAGGGSREQQLQYVTLATLWASGKNAILPNFRNWFVSVDANGVVRAELMVSENDNVKAESSTAS